MLAFGVVIALGLGLGLWRGGSLHNLRTARVQWTPLVFVAVALQVAAMLVPRSASFLAFALVVVSFLAVFLFAGKNLRVAGMMLVAAGAAMNFVVILLNRGMPISSYAAARVGFAGARAEQLVARGKHFINVSGHVHLPWLGDVIPLWRQPTICSAGDLIIWAGIILLVASFVIGPRGRRTKMDPRDEYTYVPPEHVSARAGDASLDALRQAERNRVIDIRDVHEPTEARPS